MSLSHRQHTVLLLLALIVALRLAGQGRLQTAWATLWGNAPIAPAQNAGPEEKVTQPTQHLAR